ncbi:MAG TPA: SDR family oxidoreductase [Hyphomicrobiales bacterium]|nr:SDR family oxidoreductase [Hyphomicrobiales bacterium]
MDSVVVTGGSRGIGLAIVRRLAADGFRAIAIARRESEELAAAMGAAPEGAIRFVACDLADVEGLAAMVRGLREEFGQLFGLVNNAGIGTGGVLATMRDDDIERLVRLNTLSPIVLTKHVLRTMLADGAGRIVNVSSITAATGYTGLSAYSATKASLVGFTRALAREVGRAGVTVNAVAPGFIATDMTAEMGEGALDKLRRRSALRRLAEADDVAAAVAFLLGAGGRNVTGTVTTIDAGATA